MSGSSPEPSDQSAQELADSFDAQFEASANRGANPPLPDIQVHLEHGDGSPENPANRTF
jgi:hypothetical protein